MATLDLSAARLEYLAEGAANVVYKIVLQDTAPNTTSIHNPLHGKVLRLRKNLPSATSVLESHQHFKNTIEPLFPAGSLVEASLIKPSPAILEELNRKLQEMELEGTRPIKRRDMYLSEQEKYGTLITDMSPPPNSIIRTYEFKPKWLVQSPSAPAGSRRCRTCALRAMKVADRKGSPDNDLSDASFCPLKLASHNPDHRADAVNHIVAFDPDRLRDSAEVTKDGVMLLSLLNKNPILERLRSLQLEKDQHGALKADMTSLEFLTAMTLRDCTMFVQFSVLLSSRVPIQARLGDLDLKSPAGNKAEYWRDLEEQLIRGGWYTATEPGVVHDLNTCLLA